MSNNLAGFLAILEPETMKYLSTIFSLTLYLCVAVGFSTNAGAHGRAVELKDDRCAKWSGADVVHFNVYQPQFDKRANYCGDIPNTGEAIVVVDLVNQKLRETPVSFKLVERVEGGAENAVLELPPKIYKQGVIEIPTSFENAGYYMAYITISGSTTQQPAMGYRVALRKQYGAPPIQFLLTALVLVAFGVLLTLMFAPVIKRMFGKG